VFARPANVKPNQLPNAAKWPPGWGVRSNLKVPPLTNVFIINSLRITQITGFGLFGVGRNASVNIGRKVRMFVKKILDLFTSFELSCTKLANLS